MARGFASQEALAEHLGMHRTFIGHLETGRKDFRLSTLIRVAEALDVELAELFRASGKTPLKARAAADGGRQARLRELAELERVLERLKKLS